VQVDPCGEQYDDRRLALIMDPDGNRSELVGTAGATAVEIKPRDQAWRPVLSGEPGEPGEPALI
jgi:hypothetical protein